MLGHFDKLSAPHFDKLSAPHFDKLSAPHFDKLSAPRFDKLSAPRFDKLSDRNTHIRSLSLSKRLNFTQSRVHEYSSTIAMHHTKSHPQFAPH